MGGSNCRAGRRGLGVEENAAESDEKDRATEWNEAGEIRGLPSSIEKAMEL